MTARFCCNWVTSTASGLNMHIPEDGEETRSLSNYGREKDTWFVDGCKNRQKKAEVMFS